MRKVFSQLAGLVVVTLVALVVSTQPAKAVTYGGPCEVVEDCGVSNATGSCGVDANGRTLCCEANPSGEKSCADRTPLNKSRIPEVNSMEEANAEGQPISREKTNWGIWGDSMSVLYLRLVGTENDPGLTASMSKGMAAMYANPPATTERYIADVLNSAHIVPKAYAQGVGFSALNPLLETWRLFRNIAYFFFVVLFLIIGFMIMFRYKIGQAAVTAQQAIPRIIIALVAVTFSYAIAGLLIDMMYLLMFLLIGVFGVSQNDFLALGPVGLGMKLISGGFEEGRQGAEQLVNAIIGNNLGILDSFGGLTTGVVVAVAVALGVFKLFMNLLRTYVSIIISIATAPIILMMGAIPGKNTFGPWVRSLIGNLMAFPIVLIFLIIFEKLTNGITGNATPPEGGFTPPYLFSVGGTQIIPFALGLGGLLALDKLVEDGKAAFGAKKGFFDPYMGAVTDSVKKGWKGGELIPGMGFTDTKKIPFIGSGKNFATDTPTAAASLVGGLRGLAVGAGRQFGPGGRGMVGPTAQEGWRGAGRHWADTLGSSTLYTKDRAARKEGKASYTADANKSLLEALSGLFTTKTGQKTK